MTPPSKVSFWRTRGLGSRSWAKTALPNLTETLPTNGTSSLKKGGVAKKSNPAPFAPAKIFYNSIFYSEKDVRDSLLQTHRRRFQEKFKKISMRLQKTQRPVTPESTEDSVDPSESLSESMNGSEVSRFPHPIIDLWCEDPAKKGKLKSRSSALGIKPSLPTLAFTNMDQATVRARALERQEDQNYLEGQREFGEFCHGPGIYLANEPETEVVTPMIIETLMDKEHYGINEDLSDDFSVGDSAADNHKDPVKALAIMCTICFSAIAKELLNTDANSAKVHNRVLKELLRSKELEDKAAFFVSFETYQPAQDKYELRGQAGTFTYKKLTWLTECAKKSAFRDQRFIPISAQELARLHVGVSILHTFEPMNSLYDFDVGTNGIIIMFTDLSERPYSATFLPETITTLGGKKNNIVMKLIRKAGYLGCIHKEFFFSERFMVYRFQTSRSTLAYVGRERSFLSEMEMMGEDVQAFYFKEEARSEERASNMEGIPSPSMLNASAISKSDSPSNRKFSNAEVAASTITDFTRSRNYSGANGGRTMESKGHSHTREIPESERKRISQESTLKKLNIFENKENRSERLTPVKEKARKVLKNVGEENRDLLVKKKSLVTHLPKNEQESQDPSKRNHREKKADGKKRYDVKGHEELLKTGPVPYVE